MMRVTMRANAGGLLAILLFGCSDGNAHFLVRESVQQLAVTHAPPGTALEVVDPMGKVVASASADAQGSVMFRNLAPGDGYVVRTTTMLERSRHLKVMSVEDSLPAQRFY